MARLLLADRVKDREGSFLAPLMPALARRHEVRFTTAPPGPALAAEIAWADIVWLEWCWDHAAWATTAPGVLGGRGCVVRLHSIEALQTDFPARVDWARVDALVTVGEDIAALVRARYPGVAAAGRVAVVPNGIDLARFRPGAVAPDPFQVAWVGHVEPKKNPMLLLQVAHEVLRQDGRFRFHVAGGFTDLRTLRYLERMVPLLGLEGAIRFHGAVADMPAWYADKGVLLSTTMYESFGLNIGEAMAVGAYPVVHDFPGAERLWPPECLFASVGEAAALIRAGRPGLYRDWVAERYGLARQEAAVLEVLEAVTPRCRAA
jgi:glycosyltransferase involved in cell wall biosynthesis